MKLGVQNRRQLETTDLIITRFLQLLITVDQKIKVGQKT